MATLTEKCIQYGIKDTLDEDTIESLIDRINNGDEIEDIYKASSSSRYDNMTYEDIKELCKNLNIKANIKKNDMIEQLQKNDKGEKIDSKYLKGSAKLVNGLTYKEIQQKCKDNNIKANMSKEKMLEALKLVEDGETVPNEYRPKKSYKKENSSGGNSTYKDLQESAKKHGLKANMKGDDIKMCLDKLEKDEIVPQRYYTKKHLDAKAKKDHVKDKYDDISHIDIQAACKKNNVKANMSRDNMVKCLKMIENGDTVPDNYLKKKV